MVENADVESLSSEALQSYIERSGRKLKIESKEFFNELLAKGLLVRPNDSNLLIPSGDGICVLVKVRDKFPQASVKAKVEYGTGEIDTQSFDDALVLNC